MAYDAASRTATFTPGAALGNDLIYRATVTTGAQDSANVALAGEHTWTFTTVAATSPPEVDSTTPPDFATDVAVAVSPSAAFTKAMDPASLTSLTFTLKQGAASIAGAVTYDPASHVATFNPTADLSNDLLYTATITTGARDATSIPMAADFVWSFTTAAVVHPPTVTSTTPLDLATNVPVTVNPTATFSEDVDPLTVNFLSFTMAQGSASIPGVVTYDAPSRTATFNPTDSFDEGLLYTATISTNVEDLSGLAMEQDHTWSFTTAAAPVLVVTTSPPNEALNVTVNKRPSATFNREMDPLTLTTQTFTVMQGTTPVAGTVTYDAQTKTVTFTPDEPLGLDLVYTATITTGARDTGGVGLASDFVWTFSTSACSQEPIDLGAGVDFVVHAGSTVTNTGPTSVTGDLSLSPGTSVTGFPPGNVVGTQHVTDPKAAEVAFDLTVAYNDAAGRTLCPVTKIGNIGGQTLPPGLYKSTGAMEVSGSDVVLDAQGDSEAVFIFQIASTLSTTAGRQVLLIGGAKSSNVFWQVGTAATFATTTAFQGTIMADQAITMNTGATLNGRVMARIGAVNLDSNEIVKPAP